LSYVVETMKNFLKLKPVGITIKIPGMETISEDLFVVTIANNRQFGNNAFIAPDAKPNDGLIDIVLIRPFPKILALFFIYRLFSGTIKRSKYVRYLKTDKPFTIHSEETRFHIDGEPVTISGDVVVHLRRNSLNVLKTRHYRL
jgi:diacylglycerol kinase (ATP)